ncbi:MAG: hypothetical protein ACK55Z_35040, partial [bacterium]
MTRSSKCAFAAGCREQSGRTERNAPTAMNPLAGQCSRRSHRRQGARVPDCRFRLRSPCCSPARRGGPGLARPSSFA